MTRARGMLAALLLSGAAAGCVTINIYFPAAAAEQAADRIIDEVWQQREASRADDGVTDSDGETQ